MSTLIKARPTVYNGIRMRSRLEADYAAYLDSLGYRWQYEPECFASAAGQWLPDFGASFAAEGSLGIFMEVKPAGPLAECIAGHDGVFEYVDSIIRRMTIAWASLDAQLELVFWHYGDDSPYLHLFSPRRGAPWLAWDRRASSLAAVLWGGMGQYASRGIEADWYHRGPCGCGSDGCWVLAADGEESPGEVHCPA